jgi:CelD/BcsL family acetyltransferase involved in cellulose biosynthesis
MLVDKDHASDVLTLLFNHFSQLWQKNWHGIFFEKRAADGPLAELEKHISNEFGMKWHSSQEWERGILHLEDCGDSNFENLSKNIRKNINRRLRRLGEMGDVQWNVLRGNKLTSKNINQFIKLEHMGWKGEQGTSLYSNPKHLKFFQEVIDGFNREGRAFFAELQLNGNVISSTSNLISGNVGFAIKIGWDPAYSKFSPGVLNEAKWLQHGDKMFKELEFLDSGASENSYINDIWIKKRSLKSGIYTITDIGKLSLRGIHLVKSLKKKISRPA